MSTRPELAKFARGLLNRLSAFCPNGAADVNDIAFKSIAGEVYASKQLQKNRRASKSNPLLDTEVIKLALHLRTQIDQDRLFDRFKGTVQFDLLRVLALGEQFCDGLPNYRAIGSLTDIDFSIVRPSLFLELINSTGDKLSQLVKAQIRKHMDKIGFQRPTNCSSLVAAFECFGLRPKLQSLTEISDAFYELKQNSWSLFGSDILVFMQGLADPNSRFNRQQLGAMFQIAECWQLGTVASRLILLRAINRYQDEKEFVKSNHDEIVALARLPETLLCAEQLTEQHEGEFRKNYAECSDPVEAAIFFCSLFYHYLQRQELNNLLELVRDQYERDPASLAFINWDEFYAKAAINWGQHYLLNILLSVSLLSASISARFESIDFSYGEGFVTNQILNLVTDLRAHNHGLAQFARLISGMGPKARATIAAFVLQKTVIEVYATSFREKSIFSKFKIRIADLEVCHARMRLAHLFRESRVLPADYCDRIIEEEAAFRKMHRFHEVFRSSRIRIDWKYLELEILETLQDDFGFFFDKFRGPLKAGSSVADIMATIVGQRICELTLFDSATSLERALSNNLRHGVVVPRFLRAFAEAIASHPSTKSATGSANRDWYEVTFERGSARLIELEDAVITQIASYQEEWLKVKPDGPLYREMIDGVESAITANLSKASGFVLKELVAKIVEVQKVTISSILQKSRGHLLRSVKADVEKLLSFASIDIRERNDTGSSEFLDSLSIFLNDAFKEVAGWISLFDSEASNSIEFEIGDLIDEETNTFVISDRSRAHIRHECFDRRDGQLRKIKSIKISGRAYELMDQIIHNCLSNARKRSGLGNGAKILIRVTRDVDGLTIWCRNSFAPDKLPEMKQHQAQAKKIVSDALRTIRESGRRNRSRMAYKEGGYGFMKIIDACERLCGAPPVFNFPIIKSDQSHFIVEIRLAKLGAMLL